ncbi:MAG: glycosyltransferase family 4 protein, partial [Roseibium sp.]
KRQEIVYVGRARQDKGLLPLIGAYRSLSANDWSLKLILGVQTEAETSFAKQIDVSCADLANVAIFQNAPSAAVQRHLSEAAIAALPSIVREGFPRAVVEAMASGCAVIATNQGGTPEAAGDAALLLDEPDTEDFETRLTNSLAELINDGQRRNQLATAGRQRVVGALGLEAVANRYDNLLEKLAEA